MMRSPNLSRRSYRNFHERCRVVAPGHVLQPFEQLTKEPDRGLGVPSGGAQDVQHVPVLVHRPLQVAPRAVDRDEHLIDVPLLPRARPVSA
jgi:hypothetical protein